MACIASPNRYSRNTGPSAALPSPPRENGVGPEPFRWMSRRACDRSKLRPKQCAPVAQLWRKSTKLMPGIGHRQGLCTLGRGFARQNIGPIRRLQRVRIQPQLLRQCPVQSQNLRIWKLRALRGHEKPRKFARIAVVEMKGGIGVCHVFPGLLAAVRQRPGGFGQTGVSFAAVQDRLRCADAMHKGRGLHRRRSLPRLP